MKQEFEVISRGLIQKNKKILVCQRKDKDYYFLPGGHVELGETSKQALIREIKEERSSEIKNISFIGIIENFFKDGFNKHHEINIIFQAEEKNEKQENFSAENHLVFKFLNIDEFIKCNIQPIVLKEKIIEYLDNKKVFWKSNNE